MRGNAKTRQRALWVRGFTALLAVAALFAVASPRPAEAVPFAYVATVWPP